MTGPTNHCDRVSVQAALKQSFPELDEDELQEMWLRFWRASMLGYRSLTLGIPEREGWDEILGCLQAERQRRWNTPEHRALVERLKAAKRVPKITQEEWDALSKNSLEDPPESGGEQFAKANTNSEIGHGKLTR